MQTIHSLREAQHQLTRATAAVDYWREHVNRLSLDREALEKELKNLGFHDVGHARGALSKAAVDQQVLRPAEAPALCPNCTQKGSTEATPTASLSIGAQKA